MLTHIVNEVIKKYQQRRYRRRIIPMLYDSPKLQKDLYEKIIGIASKSEYARERGVHANTNLLEFKNRIDLNTYEDLYPYIKRMMLGESDVLYPGQIQWFAKSSGTTSDRSKFIPVSDHFLYDNLITSSWDTTCFIYKNRPDAKLFSGKSLIMGGTLDKYSENPSVTIGDVSAIMIDNIPPIGRPFYTPDMKTALLSDWNEKLDNIIKECLSKDIVMFGGVPTWNIVLFNQILEQTGRSNIMEVWPNLKTYIHGGVSFLPYKEEFQKFLPVTDFEYYEVYNASEGYFAVQDIPNGDEGMLLLTDSGIFYEFIDFKTYEQGSKQTVGLEDVEIGVNYVLVITTTSGLWRYSPGDTIMFTSINPYRIKVTGRTKQHINVFGEEVMVSNTDAALKATCHTHCCTVKEYTVGPVFLNNSNKGGHEWLIEFYDNPKDVKQFELDLDKNLRAVNSDYDAKRTSDLALVNLVMTSLPHGTFHQWMAFKGKLGGQNKVPRLSNDRRYVDEIKSFLI